MGAWDTYIHNEQKLYSKYLSNAFVSKRHKNIFTDLSNNKYTCPNLHSYNSKNGFKKEQVCIRKLLNQQPQRIDLDLYLGFSAKCTSDNSIKKIYSAFNTLIQSLCLLNNPTINTMSIIVNNKIIYNWSLIRIHALTTFDNEILSIDLNTDTAAAYMEMLRKKLNDFIVYLSKHYFYNLSTNHLITYDIFNQNEWNERITFHNMLKQEHTFSEGNLVMTTYDVLSKRSNIQQYITSMQEIFMMMICNIIYDGDVAIKLSLIKKPMMLKVFALCV